jgi:hypothetical protein
MFCGFCGVNNSPDHRFCVGCGKELSALPQTTAAAASQQVLGSVATRLRALASTYKLVGYSLKILFSVVFRKRS